MKEIKISVPEESGHYYIREYGDFEYKKPKKHFKKTFVKGHIWLYKNSLKTSGLGVLIPLLKEKLRTDAQNEWKDHYKKIKRIKIPKELKEILNADAKSEQVKALKGISLSTDKLVAFIIYAFKHHGYLFSQYSASHHHKGFDEKLMPALVHIEENGSVKTIGKTKLSTGQLRQVVKHRSVKVAKFLDLGDSWHCFFLTYKSLKGEEKHNDGKPHLHYISDKWGLTRDEVKEQLTSKKYSLPSVPHIDFKRH